MSLSRRIWTIGTAVMVLLFLLSARLVYWQLVRGDELQPVVFKPVRLAGLPGDEGAGESAAAQLARLQEMPQPVVQRTSAVLATITRGTIFDRNGRPLAYDEPDEQGGLVRVYAEPSLAAVIGYASGLRIGVAGIEQRFNDSLWGLDRPINQFNRLIHQPTRGNDVHLTIDSGLQQAAVAALAGRPGGIVVLDAASGAILAMASAPSFDPNQILEPDYLNALVQCAAAECQGALINRATQGLYTPGSTWKTVTLIAALDSGLVTPDTVFDFGQMHFGPEGGYYIYEVDGAVVTDPNHVESRLTLPQSYAVSANAAFARLGDELPPETLIDYSLRLGFGREDGPPLEIPAAPARLADDLEELRANNVLQAATGFGQGELLTSPLSMALVVSAVVNRGVIPTPHLLLRVEDAAGTVYLGEPGGTWIGDVMRPETAEQVAAIMIYAVTDGSGRAAAVPGLVVGGKTGTAEVGEGVAPHAWFAGFANRDDRTVIISVVVEHGGEGSTVAAPIFAQVAAAAFAAP
jgi:peptidoglycan glycosyltransferase